MTQAEAKSTLLRHAEGAPAETPATLLESLRPYRGIRVEHFLEILQALVVIAPALRSDPTVDREVVHAIWELCRTARDWTRGPHEPMFHGREFIPASEKKALDEWVDAFESITLYLLRGEDESLAFMGVPWLVARHRLAPRATFLAPLFIESLRQLHEDESDSGVLEPDDGEALCQLLAEMGSAAKGTIPVLRQVQSNTRFAALRAAAAGALRALE